MGKNRFTVLFRYSLIISSSPDTLPLLCLLTVSTISSPEISWSEISMISWLSILSKSSWRFILSVFGSSFSFNDIKYSYNWSIVTLIFLFLPFLPNLFRIFRNVFESCFDVFRCSFSIFFYDFYNFCSFHAYISLHGFVHGITFFFLLQNYIYFFAVWFLLRFSRHDLLNQCLSDLLQSGFIFIVGYVLVYLRIPLMETIESDTIVSSIPNLNGILKIYLMEKMIGLVDQVE